MLKKFGADLRKIREGKRITLRDISGKTRLHISHFEKMENGDFQFFDATYVRAILRQYAKALNLDPNTILFNYDLAKNGKYNSGFLSDYLPETKTEDKDDTSGKIELNISGSSAGNYSGSDEPGLSREEEKQEFVQPGTDAKNKNANVFSVPDIQPGTGTGISDISEYRDGVKPVKRKFSTSKRVKIEGEKGDMNGDYYRQDGLRIPYSFLKSAGVAVLVILMAAGVYLLIDVVFLQKKDTKTDLIRPNFDDIVKENEKKILGKKTDEEIRDSIAKETARLDSLKRIQDDSLSFSIKTSGRGTIYVTVDSLIEENVSKQRFREGDSLVFKAKKTFWVTSKNTENFTAYLNGSRIKFPDTEVKAVKITRKGIQKKITTQDGNEPRKEDKRTPEENL